MVRLELDQVVMRRMKEDDIETVKALIKVRTGRLVLNVSFIFYLKSHRFLSRRAARVQKTA